ncbi:MAG: hypothetical protein JO209_11330 [Acidisphaera sp.]|nr:hypothetical protein [Acidisphaera sp.]
MKYSFPIRPVLAALALGAASVPVLLPTPAHAWWHGGFFIGVPFPPVVIAPPVYAPPPVVYAPPPAYDENPAPQSYSYTPAPPGYAYTPSPGGGTCYAGAYTCPLQYAAPAGSSCSCPGNTGRVYGRSG